MILISLAILLIISSSLFQSWRYPEKFLRSYPITVVISGAVKYPGAYKVYPGITIEKVLKKSGLLDKADIKNLNFSTPLYDSVSLTVPLLEHIIVHVKGAVEEKTLKLKPGTRMRTLKKYLSFKGDPDLSILNTMKKLKDGETIMIPEAKPLSAI